MDIEELTKSQLLLLTLLVTFVTSIATGILTVSMLDQAPPVVTQTVNRIVERTVKTVAPALPASVVKTITQAPAPSNEDLVTSALAAQDARTVLLYKVNLSTTTPAIAVGTYLSTARAVVTVSNKNMLKQAMIEFPDGSTKPVTLVRIVDGLALYGFSDSAKLPKTQMPKLIHKSSLKLGETVLAIRGDGSATTGIISQINKDTIKTTLPTVGAGVGVVDMSGSLVGISAHDTNKVLISAASVTSILEATSTIETKDTSTTSTTSTSTTTKKTNGVSSK